MAKSGVFKELIMYEGYPVNKQRLGEAPLGAGRSPVNVVRVLPPAQYTSDVSVVCTLIAITF